MSIRYEFVVPKALCPVCKKKHRVSLQSDIHELGWCKLGQPLKMYNRKLILGVMNKKVVLDDCVDSCYTFFKKDGSSISFKGKIWIENGIFTKYKLRKARKWWWED